MQTQGNIERHGASSFRLLSATFLAKQWSLWLPHSLTLSGWAREPAEWRDETPSPFRQSGAPFHLSIKINRWEGDNFETDGSHCLNVSINALVLLNLKQSIESDNIRRQKNTIHTLCFVSYFVSNSLIFLEHPSIAVCHWIRFLKFDNFTKLNIFVKNNN